MLDAISFLSRYKLVLPLERYVQIDIDDISLYSIFICHYLGLNVNLKRPVGKIQGFSFL